MKIQLFESLLILLASSPSADTFQEIEACQASSEDWAEMQQVWNYMLRKSGRKAAQKYKYFRKTYPLLWRIMGEMIYG